MKVCCGEATRGATGTRDDLQPLEALRVLGRPDRDAARGAANPDADWLQPRMNANVSSPPHRLLEPWPTPAPPPPAPATVGGERLSGAAAASASAGSARPPLGSLFSASDARPSSAADSLGLIHGHPYLPRPVGHVDERGLIHNEPYRYNPIGRVDGQGVVHAHPYSHHPVGRVDSRGFVHNHPHNHSPVGHVDSKGFVHSAPYGHKPIGHVDGRDDRALERVELSGAALLLLLSRNTTRR